MKITDNKLRRVSLARQHFRLGEYFEKVKDNPNGTHHLAPVAEYVPVRREVWEWVEAFLIRRFGTCEPDALRAWEEMHRALAEIEEVE